MNLLQMSCVMTWAQKKFSLQPQKKKKKAVFLKKNISNWDFHFEISQLRKKVFILTSKMWIRTLYVKRFRSSDLFVFYTLPQRLNSAKRKILVFYKTQCALQVTESDPQRTRSEKYPPSWQLGLRLLDSLIFLSIVLWIWIIFFQI